MPPRRRNTESKKKTTSVKGVIEGAGRGSGTTHYRYSGKNYMPYAMSVIMSVPFRKLTALNRLTVSCCIPCIKWGYLVRQEQNQPILWDKP